VLYLLTLAVFVAVPILLYTQPQPQTIYDLVNGGEVQFTTSGRYLLLPSQCLNVTWDVEGIHQVYFDDRGAVGQGTGNYCPNTANQPTPKLYVHFQNDLIQSYFLPVTVLLTQPGYLVTGFVLVLVGIFTFVSQPAPDRTNTGISRRAWLRGIGATVVVLLGGGGVAAVVQQTRDQAVIHEGWLLHESEVRQ
jgi:hypothetical protein